MWSDGLCHLFDADTPDFYLVTKKISILLCELQTKCAVIIFKGGPCISEFVFRLLLQMVPLSCTCAGAKGSDQTDAGESKDAVLTKKQ